MILDEDESNSEYEENETEIYKKKKSKSKANKKKANNRMKLFCCYPLTIKTTFNMICNKLYLIPEYFTLQT